MRKRLSASLALALVLVLALTVSACTAQRRPAPGTPNLPPPGGTTPPTTPGETVRDVAASISSAIAGMGLPGVRTVHTVTLSNVALVGLEMTTNAGPSGTPSTGAAGPGTTGGGTTGRTGAGATTPTAPATPGTPGTAPGGTATGTAPGTSPAGTAPGAAAGGPMTDQQRAVADRVRTMFPQVVDVYVTSDPARVAELARIADDVRRGVPITNHMDRLTALVKALKPAATTPAAPGTTPGRTAPGVTGGTTGAGTR